jgi:hypothetical protein
MSGRDKTHGIAPSNKQTLCGRQIGSAVGYADDAAKVTCLRCKNNEGWTRFFNATIRRRGGA